MNPKYPMMTTENCMAFDKWLLETEVGQETAGVISRSDMPKTMRAVAIVAFCSGVDLGRQQEKSS